MQTTCPRMTLRKSFCPFSTHMQHLLDQNTLETQDLVLCFQKRKRCQNGFSLSFLVSIFLLQNRQSSQSESIKRMAKEKFKEWKFGMRKIYSMDTWKVSHQILSRIQVLNFLVPDIVVKRDVKHRPYDKAIQVLRETHEKYNWTWNV